MSQEILSLRIVDLSHTMCRPVYGLDPCFSEFRAKEIKSVPVIRIFGTCGDGIKTCLHVHGVLPYFYIPYEKKAIQSFDGFVYNLCESLDKALNISLGQSSSKMHHIFKVQLVKAFPFYGYHRKEHLFLKIYMYNPRLLKRAANILQNGALNGKSFQSFDSHVPYRLQFLIDYNLFPMSLMHIPLDKIGVRKSDDILINVKPEQIFDNTLEKITTSSLEIDVNAAHIMNRIQLQNELAAGKKAINPGIESIWLDEEIRRKKCKEKNKEEFPPLEIPPSEERPLAKPTESELFYRAALERKLTESNSQTTDTTFDNSSLSNSFLNIDQLPSSPNEKKRKYNVTKLLKNAIYPEEYSQDTNLLNGTLVEDHLNVTSTFKNKKKSHDLQRVNEVIDDSIFDEDTLDEQDILKLSQKTLKNLDLNETGVCDKSIIDFLNHLEQDDESETQIDLDSTLAPLSQQKENANNAEVLEFLQQLNEDDKTNIEKLKNFSQKIQSDSEDECLNDYTMANEDIEEVLGKLSQEFDSDLTKSEKIPQLDGVDNDLKTPTKNSKNTISPNKQSPRTPKSVKRRRYAPLQGLTTFSPKSLKKNKSKEHESDTEVISASSEESYQPKQKRLKRKMKRSLSKHLDNDLQMNDSNMIKTQLVEDIISISSEDYVESNSKKQTAVIPNLNKTEIKVTCNLRTPKQQKRKNSLKTQQIGSGSSTSELLVMQETPSKISNNPQIENPCNNKLFKIEESNRSQHNCSDSNENRKKQENRTDSPLNRKESIGKRLLRSRLTKQLKSVMTVSESDVNIEKNENKSICLNTTGKTLTKTKKELSETAVKKSQQRPHSSKIPNSSIQPNVLANLRELGFSILAQEKKLNINANTTENKVKLNKNLVSSKVKHCKIPKMRSCKVKLKRMKFKIKTLNSSLSSNITSISLPKYQDSLNLSQIIPNAQAINADENEKRKRNSFSLTPEDLDDDLNICSFYETSLIINESPSMFSDIDSPHAFHISQNSDNSLKGNCFVKIKKTSSELTDSLPKTPQRCDESPFSPTYSNSSQSMSPLKFSDDEDEPLTKLKTHKKSPPSSISNIEVKENIGNAILEKLPILYENDNNLPKYIEPEVINIMPFYSNPKDVKKAKEVGHLTLHIPLITNPPEKLENLPINQHVIPKFDKIEDKAGNSKSLENTAKDTNELEYSDIDDDSPIKIRRQKVAMILNDSDNDSGDDDADQSYTSLTCSPLTPKQNQSPSDVSSTKSDLTKEKSDDLTKENTITPKSSKNCKVSLRKISMNKMISNSSASGKSKLQRKLNFNESSIQIDASQKSDNSDGIANIKCIPIEVLLSDDIKVEDAIAMKNSDILNSSSSQIVSSDSNSKNISFSRDASFGLSGATMDNTYGFKAKLENLQEAKADVDHNYLTTMSLEVFVKTRGILHPNPAFDEICAIFYAILNDVPENYRIPQKITGYILLQQADEKNSKMTGVEGDVTIVNNEEEMFNTLLKIVRHWDPDILAGYEVELSSWGYILDRAKALKNEFIQQLSRVPSQKIYEHQDDDEPKESYTDLDFESKIYGRILLDVWRLLRSEIALTSYTFENVMYHISHKRVPNHSYQKLTEWFVTSHTRWLVLEYYLERVHGVMELLDQLDLIGRTSEMAKLIGIQFYEILSRGSQYRVESMMLRIAKPNNLIPISPNPQQRLHMRAPEYLPLILEPQSRFYADPLIVLDFQSLYPSVMMAYNYCFSTCLGRVEHLGSSSPFEFGISMLRVSPTMLKKLLAYDMITISPCGAVFVKQQIREGVLPQMVREILDTRQMVKKSMKLHKDNHVLQRVLHSRQLALKLMANVTYGYTAANFSGRMPCVEVGDSVVGKGRETLERAIKLVEATPRWGAEVVYGDTDSLFVLCPGKTKETAFKIGEEIADAVTKDNPFPVKLKLEKVYQPSILQTKKRYVGFMYESPDQTEPIYEAKGIETVRRDGCPAVVKILEKSLRILFATKDVSKVKQYVCRQFTKIIQDKANIQDLIIAKEFRGKFGYKPAACVPALELTRKWMLTDPRKEPRRGERVPYIVTNGPPGLPIIKLIRCPHEVLNNKGLKVNALYYITRQIIPALNRCFLLIGADINDWFAELPRKNSQLLSYVSTHSGRGRRKYFAREKKSTISQYFSSTNCVIDCGRQTKEGICSECRRNVQTCVITLQNKIARLERAYYLTEKVCQSCCGRTNNINCISLDCPVIYVKEVKFREFEQVATYNELINKLLGKLDQLSMLS